jgi:hypothetical protein
VIACKRGDLGDCPMSSHVQAARIRGMRGSSLDCRSGNDDHWTIGDVQQLV